MAATGCATIQSGAAAVVTTPGGHSEAIGEGAHVVSPLATVQLYDLHAQERDENLVALTADGAPVAARTSLVTYSIAPNELVALDRELGPGYYDVVVRPLVRSTVRRVLAGYRADELDVAGIARAQAEITAIAASRLRPFHVILDSVDLRTLAVLMSADSYRRVVDVGVLDQELQATPQRLEVARRRADERREQARALAAAHARVAPTLTPDVLADRRRRAEAALLAAPSTRVIVSSHPITLEVAP